MSESKTEKKEGWMWIYGTTKWHYFIKPGMMSLCGKWMAVPIDLQQGNDDSPDNCKVCLRRLNALRLSGKAAGTA